ncbi:hypothetical protein [Nocardiopsis sp. L17-MgMaSL7]|uniref:hypothetical protein n=1 Tax=Nocardiopsis sp. L17-MgMaSL7 TaxID=1938893 RepID=UPI000D70F889|nr:hypothetical protein [Nocardiopsis sp. L17-MgMaSL7]PWV44574.1 hypothetical protein BDW27_12333 [Nocardiopsis sp. L17-MgMaSL7]
MNTTVLYHALYGAMYYHWHRYQENMDHCDIPGEIVHPVGELALKDPEALPEVLDAAVELLENSAVPKASALACLRYNTAHPSFPETARTYTRGLLASIELHGTARGA